MSVSSGKRWAVILGLGIPLVSSALFVLINIEFHPAIGAPRALGRALTGGFLLLWAMLARARWTDHGSRLLYQVPLVVALSAFTIFTVGQTATGYAMGVALFIGFGVARVVWEYRRVGNGK